MIASRKDSMLNIAGLPIDWQNDSTSFADGFIDENQTEGVMTVCFEKKMPECYGVKYADGKHFLENDIGQALCADDNWQNVTAYFNPHSDNDFVLPLAALCARFAYFDVLLFHAAVVDYNGHGVMFVGPSGVGKTTQAQLWNKFLSADIINGDKAFVRKSDNGFDACGLPWKGSSEYCLNKNVHLDAIVIMKQSTENRITKLDISVTEKLLPHVFLPYWDTGCLKEALRIFDELVLDVPVWFLECLPDEDAVKLTAEKVLCKN